MAWMISEKGTLSFGELLGRRPTNCIASVALSLTLAAPPPPPSTTSYAISKSSGFHGFHNLAQPPHAHVASPNFSTPTTFREEITSHVRAMQNVII